jgi:hypothetical protein
MVSTDIIVVLFGDRKDYDLLIKSIEAHCKDFNLITIDNNEVNRGFTKAVNEGIKAGSAPHIWLLNQDAIVLEGAQEALLNRFKNDPKVGIVGSMQIDSENPDLIRHGGTTRAFPAGVHKSGLISMGHCRFPEKQTWVNYASVMISREMTQKIGLLDENLFLVYSDSDYCYVARSKGYDVWYEPGSKVIHRLNASKNVSEWHQKDMQAFMKKWGITFVSQNQFTSSPEFDRLNRFP